MIAEKLSAVFRNANKLEIDRRTHQRLYLVSFYKIQFDKRSNARLKKVLFLFVKLILAIVLDHSVIAGRP